MDKARILREIKRTAETTEGRPLGARSFTTATGITESTWRALWPRWSDAVRAAGLEPNATIPALTHEFVVEQVIALTRKLGHFPTWAERRIEKKDNADFPGEHSITKRLGNAREVRRHVAEYCKSNERFGDVLAIIGDETGGASS